MPCCWGRSSVRCRPDEGRAFAGTTSPGHSDSTLKQRNSVIAVERHEFAFSRRNSPELCSSSPSKIKRAQGRPGGRLHPVAYAQERVARGALTDRFSRDIPAFPARWFTAYFALSSVNQRLPPSPCGSSHPQGLAPAWARQDHTTSPSASVPLVYRHSPRPPHSAPRVVTIAIRPS